MNQKTIIRSILVIPSFLIILIMLLNNVGEPIFTSKGGWSNNNESILSRSDIYELNFENGLNSIDKFSYIIGKTIKLPIYNLCIGVNDSKFLDIDKYSFKSQIYVNGEQRNYIFFGDVECFNLDINLDQEEIYVMAQYKFNKDNSNLSMDNSENYLSKGIEINTSIKRIWFNLIINIIVLLIGWIALVWLSTRIILLWRNGIE